MVERVDTPIFGVTFMSKDKPEPPFAPPKAGNPTTSFLSILQQLSKKPQKEEVVETMRTFCKCGKEIWPKRICGGHSGGGGGSEDTLEENANEESSQSSASTPNKTFGTEEWMVEASPMEDDLDFPLKSDDKEFNAQIILELINKGRLEIVHNRESRTYSMRLQCGLNALAVEQKQELHKFMKTFLAEWNRFKEENRITIPCLTLTQDKEGNILSLRIRVPTPDLYDAFIQRISNKVLPALNPATHKTALDPKMTEDTEQECFNPTPFNMTPWSGLD